MSSPSHDSPNGIATTLKSTFSRTTSIRQQIHADPDTIWALLTNAPGYAKWNSTIVSIEGDIREGGSIQLRSTLDSKRVFKLKVQAFQPGRRLVWGDFMGQRTFILEPANTGTLFHMSEKIGGPLFPLFAGKIPSFDASFEQFSADLKKAAEANAGKS